MSYIVTGHTSLVVTDTLIFITQYLIWLLVIPSLVMTDTLVFNTQCLIWLLVIQV